MTVTYYKESSVPPPFSGRRLNRFGGEVITTFTGSATLSLPDILANEVATLPALVPAYVYGYFWTAYITIEVGAEENLKMFASNPNRYQFGHITVQDKFGVIADMPWAFQDTKLPLYRNHIYEGNFDPGTPITPATPVLTDPVIFSYGNISTQNQVSIPDAERANRVGFFAPTGFEYGVIVNYYATLAFDAIDIAVSPSGEVLGIFP